MCFSMLLTFIVFLLSCQQRTWTFLVKLNLSRLIRCQLQVHSWSLLQGFSLFQGSYCSSSLDAPCHSLRNRNLKVRHLCSPGLRTVCQFLRAKCSSCQDTGFYFQEKHSLYEKFTSPYLRTLPNFKFFVFVIF